MVVNDIYSLVWFILGVLFGCLVYSIWSNLSNKYDGEIIIDDTDSEKTQWTLKYNGDPIYISDKIFVRFKVRKNK